MNKAKFFYFILILSSNLFFLPAHSDPMFEMGKDVFLNKANCAACHTLAEAGSNGQIGPNLNQIKPNMMRVMSVVKNGIGIMPPLEELLSSQEIEAVAHYVSIAASQ
tara:strand:- start:307 stop:627 length:321 start_codon:yes stop_codon:yes gene_type:complete